MANGLTSLTTTLLSNEMVTYLRKRPGFINKIYIERVQENALAGGSSIVITKPTTEFTPTTVSYSSAATAQDITLPSVTLSLNTHKEVKVSLTELESRVAKGNADRIIAETAQGIIDGLLSTVDAAVAALYSSYVYETGTYNAALTDATMRTAVQTLAANKVDVQGGGVNFITSPKGYFTDLMGIDRYVQAQIIGQDGEPIRGGKIPTLYNVGVDYSHNVQTSTISSTTVAHSLMFEKYAFVAGFMEFNAATEFGKNVQVEESMITDPVTGVAIRMQKYYDPALRTGYLQFDVKYGVAVLDSSRFVRVLHQNT